MGMVTTGTSTAAALSVPPQSFAAGTGLNQTARQIGGALGVATLATLVRSGGSDLVATFTHVYVFVLAGGDRRGAGGAGAGAAPDQAPRPRSAAAPADAGSAPVAAAPAG